VSNIDATTYYGAKAVAPSDTVNDGSWAGLWSGSGGIIKLTTEENNDVVFNNVPAGTILPIATLRVWSSTTTATNVLGLIARPHKGSP
jgi:hypothetical protein